MRAVVQRASWARVLVGSEVVGSLYRPGLVVLLAARRGDDESSAIAMADKLWHLRIVADAEGRMNRSAADCDAPLLVVSQFTLYGDVSRGRRPSWAEAESPERAAVLVEATVRALEARGATVQTGRFGAEMLVELGNDGPVTLVLEV